MLNEGLSLLSFAVLDPFTFFPSEGTLDAILINNVFIDNDFSIKNDAVVSPSICVISSMELPTCLCKTLTGTYPIVNALFSCIAL